MSTIKFATYEYRYGDELKPQHQSQELYGTCRTLDRNEGAPALLGQGLLNREGYSVIDDSETLVLDESGWPQPRNNKDSSNDNAVVSKDLFVFVYGLDYNKVIQFKTIPTCSACKIFAMLLARYQ